MTKRLELLVIQKNDEYQRELASRIYSFLDKKSPGKGMKCKNTPNQPSSKLHKPVIRKFKKRKVFSFFMDTIGCARHVYMQLIRRYRQGIRFHWYIYVFNKLKNEKVNCLLKHIK